MCHCQSTYGVPSGPRVTHYTNVAFLLPNVPNLLIAQWTLNWGAGGALRPKTPLSFHFYPLPPCFRSSCWVADQSKWISVVLHVLEQPSRSHKIWFVMEILLCLLIVPAFEVCEISLLIHLVPSLLFPPGRLASPPTPSWASKTSPTTMIPTR